MATGGPPRRKQGPIKKRVEETVVEVNAYYRNKLAMWMLI